MRIQGISVLFPGVYFPQRLFSSDILDCAEAYVDSCMNVTETAERTGLHRNTINSRLEKLHKMTGLRPSKSFKDAFIIKETAVYIRQNGKES